MIRKLTSTGYTETTLSIALLILRVGVGVLMIHHGYDKLTHFDEYKADFMNFMGLGNSISLGLTIFSELFCSVFLLVGLFTRLAAIPLVITMLVAVFMALDGAIFGKGELGTVYLFAYIAIAIAGPGKYSLDALINKRTN
jgi:putative oxidoreductase